MEHVHPDDGTSPTTCENCGTHVSASFVRVFGDNEGTLHRCSECTTVSELMDGGGSDPQR